MNYSFLVLFACNIKIHFVPNYHVKTSSLKINPPSNVEMTVCVVVVTMLLSSAAVPVFEFKSPVIKKLSLDLTFFIILSYSL